VINAVEE